MTDKTMKKRLFAILTPIFIPFLTLGVLAALNIQKVAPLEADSSEEYIPYEVANKGFETGDISGWRVINIWKGENGMVSFQREKSDGRLVDRVVDGTYFSGNNEYNRDGNYNLGIVNDDFEWEQSAERMGHLRSTDFVLGGSGYISFKLGGGRYPEFAYMSIREADTDIEVARFGNPYFDDRNKAEDIYGSGYGENAEAFMFPYYFDLTSVTALGTKLYIMLSETGSKDWSILSADSFETYLLGDPVDVELALEDEKFIPAVNILPEVLGIDTADNDIKNGKFDTNYDHWTISGDGWGWSGNKYMRSNYVNGDGGMGILRSSAFDITNKKYLKFDWKGGLAHDKQIFVSIKEVGTNLEVLRYVRRENNNRNQDNDFDNHICSTTKLNDTKLYYAEFADARTGSWGVSIVDNVRLSDSGSPDGDRAVQVLPSSSTYRSNYYYQKDHEAEAFALHFLDVTGPICETLTGEFDGAWDLLKSHYDSLSNDAKDHFVDGNSNEEPLLAARERYLFIVGKYNTLDKFVTDSQNNVYSGLASVNRKVLNESSKTVAFVFVALSIVSLGAILVLRKRKLN